MATRNHRATSIAVFILAVIAGIIIATKPAHAYEEDGSATTVEEAFWQGQPRYSLTVIEAPRWAWGIRNVAKYINANVPGMTIAYAYGVDCDDFEGERCVTVERTSFDGRDDRMSPISGRPYGGYASTPDGAWGPVWTIELNADIQPYTTFAQRTAVSNHELLHTLGFTHYVEDGSVGNSGVISWAYTTPTAAEIAVLNANYPFN